MVHSCPFDCLADFGGFSSVCIWDCWEDDVYY